MKKIKLSNPVYPVHSTRLRTEKKGIYYLGNVGYVVGVVMMMMNDIKMAVVQTAQYN